MDTGSLERLKLKNGQPVTAAHVMALDRQIVRNNALLGSGVRRRVFPWGTTRSYFGRGGGTGSAPVFQPEVETSKDGAEVRWSGPRALIGGLAPVIGTDDKAPEIFTEDADTGLRPAFKVTKNDFGAGDSLGIYFKLTTDPYFNPLKVEPIASAAAPLPQPFTGFKLALFLRLRAGAITYEEADDRVLFSSQGFLAIDAAKSGRFKALFWATF